jgi:hypothetical protein
MAKNISNLAVTDTFQVWLNKTNEMVDLINSDVLTASLSGDTTIGNATLSGDFQATNITVTGILDSGIIRTDEIRVPIGSTTNYIEMSNQTLFSSTNQAVAIIQNVNGPRILAKNNTSIWEFGLKDSTASSAFIISTQGLATPLMVLNPNGNLAVNSVSSTSMTATTMTATATTGFIGNASTASKLSTQFSITLSGVISTKITAIDGSTNLSAVTTLGDNSLENNNIRKSVRLSVMGRSANSTGDIADIAAASDHQVLRRSANQLGFGAVALNQSAAVTGALRVSNGGTGITTVVAGRILVGNGTSAFASSSNFIWDDVNNRLGIKKANPAYEIDVVGDIRVSGTMRGTATSAQYADLAEKYLSDIDYPAGTVVCVGGEYEITATGTDDLAIGVISEFPAFRMNDGLEDGIFVALKGRVPVKVVGSIVKGDKLVPASKTGFATCASDLSARNIFAVALNNSKNGVVEAVIL